MEAVTFKQQFRVVGPDGTQIAISAAKAMNIHEVFSNEASAKTLAGEAVRIDSTNSVLMRFDRAAAGSSLPTDYPQDVENYVLRVSAAGNVNWVGVAMEDILAQKTGRVMGSGSICGVIHLDNAGGRSAPTSTTLGAQVIGSGSAGYTDAVGPNAAGSATSAPAGGTVLGRLAKQAGTGAGQTGKADVAGVIVGHP